MYAAQEIPQIDTEIAEKDHLWMETNSVLTQSMKRPSCALGLIFLATGRSAGELFFERAFARSF